MSEQMSEQEQVKGLDATEIKAARMIAEGHTYGDTAEACDMSRVTLYRVRQQATFRAYLERLKRDMRDAARDGIVSLVSEAVQTVQDVMEAPDASASDRLRAARYVLDQAQSLEIGDTDPVAIVRREVEARHTWDGEMLMQATMPDRAEEEMSERLRELGLED